MELPLSVDVELRDLARFWKSLHRCRDTNRRRHKRNGTRRILNYDTHKLGVYSAASTNDNRHSNTLASWHQSCPTLDSSDTSTVMPPPWMEAFCSNRSPHEYRIARPGIFASRTHTGPTQCRPHTSPARFSKRGRRDSAPRPRNRRDNSFARTIVPLRRARTDCVRRALSSAPSFYRAPGVRRRDTPRNQTPMLGVMR